MYFWHVEDLKTEMATRPWSAREVLPYVVVYSAFHSAALGFYEVALYKMQSDLNIWDGVETVSDIFLAVVGTIYVYRQNGSASGEHFLQRYFAVGWVVTLRCLAAVVPVGVGLYATLFAMGIASDDTAWHDALISAAVTMLIYWRVGHHVRDLAQRTNLAQAT